MWVNNCRTLPCDEVVTVLTRLTDGFGLGSASAGAALRHE